VGKKQKKRERLKEEIKKKRKAWKEELKGKSKISLDFKKKKEVHDE
jgi:hypothetical protein